MSARATCTARGCDAEPRPWTGTGRPPTRCEKHDRNKGRSSRRRPTSAPPAPPEGLSEDELERRAGQHQVKRERAKRTLVALRAWQARQLAVALGWEPDVQKAAALVGLELEGDELAELAADARRHAGLIAREPGAIGDLVNGAIALRAIAIAAGIDGDAQGLLKLAEALERIQGKAQVAFTTLVDILDVPGATAWTMNDLLPQELRVIQGGKAAGE